MANDTINMGTVGGSYDFIYPTRGSLYHIMYISDYGVSRN